MTRLLIIALALSVSLWGATETQRPDTAPAQAGFTDCTVAEIDEDPDSPGSDWCDVGNPDASNISPTEVRVTFPTPSGDPTVGAGLQEFRVQFRKTSPSTDPACKVDLYENGSLVTADIIAATSISSTTGTVLAGTWNASALSQNDGSLVEAFVNCVHGGGGPGNRAVGEVGAVEWNVEYDVPGAGGWKRRYRGRVIQ